MLTHGILLLSYLILSPFVKMETKSPKEGIASFFWTRRLAHLQAAKTMSLSF